MKYACLVMDHDDTAVQSEATVNYPYFEQAVHTYCPGAEVSLEKYTSGCYHLGFARMCRQWYGFTDQDLEEEFKGWQTYIRTHRPLPYPGIRELLQRFRQAGGKICVVSHSCEENITRDYKDHFGLLPDAIYGWDLPEEQRKPSTYPLERIMETYGLEPKDLLVVDDMKPAWEMANKAGCDIAFAGWGRKNCPEVAQEMERLCTYHFDSPQELEKMLFEDLTAMV